VLSLLNVTSIPDLHQQHTCAYSGWCSKYASEQGAHEQLQTKPVQEDDAGEATRPSIVRERRPAPGS